jgi:hypothetical protein
MQRQRLHFWLSFIVRFWVVILSKVIWQSNFKNTYGIFIQSVVARLSLGEYILRKKEFSRMKQHKIQPDQQGQQHQQLHVQQKQQQKTRHEKGPKKLVQDKVNYQEHEHPEARMTD